jgi:hypothetical protein
LTTIFAKEAGALIASKSKALIRRPQLRAVTIFLEVTRTRITWSNAGGRWSKELVAYALDRYHRRNLRTPTVRELRAGVAELPSHATIRRMYGSASRMYEEHGYRVRKRGGQPGRRTTLARDSFGRFVPRAVSDRRG